MVKVFISVNKSTNNIKHENDSRAAQIVTKSRFFLLPCKHGLFLVE